MKSSTSKYLTTPLLSAFLIALFPLSTVQAEPIPESIRSSVVKIYTTHQRSNYVLPWQTRHPGAATGSGFVIKGKRILTNAHVVSDSRVLEVQKENDPRRYKATIEFIGHDCDLAVLLIEDKTFFKGLSEAKFTPDLPSLNDDVTVLGYPMGGDRLSITRGIVSRIDYSGYSHSGVDQHLVVQVDAAINPGNSGGPIIYDNKVAGLAFQGISRAENIGYAIPVPVIQHFLDDIKDGTYHGYPEMGAAFMNTRNTALRKSLKLPEEKNGVAIYYIDPFGSSAGILKLRDVLLKIDGYEIANDGSIELDGNPMLFAEMLERKQWGDSINLSVWRNGKEVSVKMPLTNKKDPFIYRNIYDERPEYYVIGGLVFSPLNREYLRTQIHLSDRSSQQLIYYSDYAKIDELYKNKEEFVVLIRRLPHAVNTYANSFINGIVTTVNGIKINKLEDVKKAIKSPENGYHIMRFAGVEDNLILDAKKADKVNTDILKKYGVPQPEHFGKSK